MADAATTTAPVTFKKRSTKNNARKRAVTPPAHSDSDSGFESSEDEHGRPIKRRKRDATVRASTVRSNVGEKDHDVPSVRAVTVVSNADNATKPSNWYDQDADHNAVKSSGLHSTDLKAADGTYKGAANYQSYIQTNPDRPGSKQVGPQKTSTNVRTITVTDFAPDVCKDYKQTGFCGFGDSCKFLHAREAYAQGWQLDREWEINTKDKKLGGKTVASANRAAQPDGKDEDDEALLEKIPFACIICKQAYKHPTVTKCGHYFCEDCALKRYRKDPSCAACGAGTGGVFNGAKKLNRLLDRKRERQKAKRDKAIENGEEPPEDDAVM